MLKGALLPSGAGAWLLGAEEARGPLAPGRIRGFAHRAGYQVPLVSENGWVSQLWLGGGLQEDKVRDGVSWPFFRTRAGRQAGTGHK